MFLHLDYIKKRKKTYPVNHTAMFRNYFTVTVRQLKKNRAFALINLSGLALGMAAFVLILQYVSFQQSFNRFHTHLPNLYRVLFREDGESQEHSISPGGYALAKKTLPKWPTSVASPRGWPEVRSPIRTNRPASTSNRTRRSSRLPTPTVASSACFRFPSCRVPRTRYKLPTRWPSRLPTPASTSASSEPLGKVLTLNNQFGSTAYTVGTVYQDPPPNSDIRYDMLFSLSTLANPANLNGNDWANLKYQRAAYLYTYLLLQDGADYQALEQKLSDYKQKIDPDNESGIRLQPFRYVHLAESLDDTYPTTGKLSFVYMLSGIALLILVIAWFNYVNLSTAGALKRSKEVGIRKVVGRAARAVDPAVSGRIVFTEHHRARAGLAAGNAAARQLQPTYRAATFSVGPDIGTLLGAGLAAVAAGFGGLGQLYGFCAVLVSADAGAQGFAGQSGSGADAAPGAGGVSVCGVHHADRRYAGAVSAVAVYAKPRPEHGHQPVAGHLRPYGRHG